MRFRSIALCTEVGGGLRSDWVSSGYHTLNCSYDSLCSSLLSRSILHCTRLHGLIVSLGRLFRFAS